VQSFTARMPLLMATSAFGLGRRHWSSPQQCYLHCVLRKCDMNTLHICPPQLSDVATLPWEIQKSHFSTLLFIYFRLFTLPQKKTNSNCCTAALAVYLLLFSASYYLHSPSTASGARYRRSVCIDMDMLRLAVAACCDMGQISAQCGVLRD